MLEMCWDDSGEINAFLKNHDYALLSYDEAGDRFSSDGLQAATYAHRNFFGVPNEKRGLLNGAMQAREFLGVPQVTEDLVLAATPAHPLR